MGPEWDEFVDRFVDRHLAARPHEAVAAGLHEHDGRLPDWSRDGLRADRERLRSARERARSFPPEELDERRRFERSYLVAVADRELFWLEKARWPDRNPLHYVAGLNPQVYVLRPYAPAPERMEAFTRYARAVPRAARQIRENLTPPLPHTYLELGRTAFGGLAEYYRGDVQSAFAGVDDARLRGRFGSALEGAAEALEELVAWLSDQPAAEDGYALGEDLLEEMLWATERVDASLDRLREVAREDLERNEAALEEACGRMDCDGGVEACVRSMRAEKPRTSAVEEARGQVDRLERFVRERQLVTIPEGGSARVDVSPPYLRWNLAQVDIPGVFDGDMPATYFITPPDASWSDEEKEAYLPSRHELMFISLHEVWPGHFLHFLHAHRCPFRLGRHLIGYGFAEGWAHYTEEMCCRAGLGDEHPALEVGMLVSALQRNVRFLSALGLHTGRMEVEDAERLFRQRAHQDAGSARQQAARGTFDPGYLNYTMCKLMIRKLRGDWEREASTSGDWRDFHDELLSLGGPPVPLARRRMLDEPSGPLL